MKLNKDMIFKNGGYIPERNNGGYILERDNGEKIILTYNEVRQIMDADTVLNGIDSAEYYLDGYNEDNIEESEIAEFLKNYDKPDMFFTIWSEFLSEIFYHNGKEEFDTVKKVVKYFMEKRKEENK